jgi:hypothetical protein
MSDDNKNARRAVEQLTSALSSAQSALDNLSAAHAHLPPAFDSAAYVAEETAGALRSKINWILAALKKVEEEQ